MESFDLDLSADHDHDPRNRAASFSIQDMALDLDEGGYPFGPGFSLRMIGARYGRRRNKSQRKKLSSLIVNSILRVSRPEDLNLFDLRWDENLDKIVSHLKEKVDDRDYVFFVDVSENMAGNEHEVYGVFEAIAHIAKRVSTGRMELFLSSNPEKGYHGRNPKKLLNYLMKKQVWGEKTFGDKLEKFVNGTVIPRLQPEKNRSIIPQSWKPFTLFVLTENWWGRNATEFELIQLQIRRIMTKIHAQGLSQKQISIQFIKFELFDIEMDSYLAYPNFGDVDDLLLLPSPQANPRLPTTDIVHINTVDVDISDIFLVRRDQKYAPSMQLPESTSLDKFDTDLEFEPIDIRTHSTGFNDNGNNQSLPQSTLTSDDGCSIESNSTQSRYKICVSELAGVLAISIKSFSVDIEDRRRVLEALPKLLEAFLFKIGYHDFTQTLQIHQDITIFLHKYKSEIVADTRLKLDQDDSAEELDTTSSEDFGWKVRIGHWLAQTEANKPVHQQGESSTPVVEPQDRSNELEDLTWLGDWREYILDNKHLEWLIARLRTECELSVRDPFPIRRIGQTILSYFASPGRITRETLSQRYSATMELDWDILHFFDSQEYAGLPEEVLDDVITLTGYYSDAQAVTCIQYMRQTWPLTGEITLQLIKSILKDEAEHSCELPDGTKLRAWINGQKFIVEADGVAASISETAEQLGWLGAALRTALWEDGLMCCSPAVVSIFRKSSPSPSTNIGCQIEFPAQIRYTQPTANGQCWHNIFKNPVIVTGYPIPRRTTWDTGLEIPLNMMAGLAKSHRVDDFNGKVYIKGFSNLLVPVKRTEDIVLWHLIYKEDGSHISFSDDSVEQDDEICRLPLQDFRHVLGWCTEANFYAGSVLANHPVTHSRLGRPNATGALFGTSISSGRIVTGGSSFCIGVKDQGVHLSRCGHITQLRWILRKFVLLWDEGEKRGWLINGASALLQLVQASLKYDSEGPFSEVFLFNGDELHHSNTPFTAKSAISVLINDRNRALKLYREDAGDQLFKDRIDYFYNILEKLIEHQDHVVGSHGSNFSRLPREHLEGWDFQEMSKMHDRIDPYVAKIDTKGKSWVDFTRAIKAVTLVGRGFGDIIQPSHTKLCDQWAKVPSQQYYIASCMSDLRDIIQEHGYENDGHVRLGETTIWHSPTSIFEPCQHQGTSEKHQCEPVQTLFPSALAQSLQPSTHTVPQDDRGAVIFGHNSSFPWVWEDTGPPVKMADRDVLPLPQPIELDSESNRDSDIARSLESLRTRDQDEPWSGTSSRVTSPSIGLHKSYVKEIGVYADPSMAYTRNDYTVGIICALPKELAAVLALFDIRHGRPKEPGGYNDSNQYEFGMMAQHMVVAAALPAGEYGTNSAASVATNMHRSFSALSFCLVVGIGGGVPTKENDIRLGDVVVGTPKPGWPSVIQYDLGKEKGYTGFQRTGTLHDPPRFLRTAISHLIANEQSSELLAEHLDAIALRKGMSQYSYPEQEEDVVLESCSSCRSSWRRCGNKGAHIRKRPPRPTKTPVIHYGLIASGNRVIKDAVFRDKLAQKDPVLCFEMEAAGVMNELDCLVIRGICDYCDKNKNDAWQEYAAAAAASYAKVYLTEISPRN